MLWDIFKKNNSKLQTTLDEKDDTSKLTFAFQNLTEIDPKLFPDNLGKITVLDLTENNFTGATDLRFLFDFPNLTTLILDKNQIQSKFIIPNMPNLTTLWVNHNKIENLVVFIQNLQKYCPNLVYLSMMNNKAAPSYFNGGSLIEYNDYKMYVISQLSNLQMVDHKEITSEERMQSQAIYGSGRLARYNDFSVDNQLRRRRSTLKNNKTTIPFFNSIDQKSNHTSMNKARRKSHGTSSFSRLDKNKHDILEKDEKLSEPTPTTLALEAASDLKKMSDETNQLDSLERNLSTKNIMDQITEIENIWNSEKLRPPTPSLSMLNELDRKGLEPDQSALLIPIPPPPPPHSLFN